MNFDALLKQKQEKVEGIITQYLPKEASYQKKIIEAMSYSVMVGGKRLRPILMYEAYTLFGGHKKIIEPFLAAIEMIHTYSLVHDDLPAMDNDDYRRGKLTTHKKFGEAMAILTGDALLNYAFEIMSEACIKHQDQMANAVKALGLLSKKAGIYGMIGGQVVDMESENKVVLLDQLRFIHKHKTAALIEAALGVGGILADAPQDAIEQMTRIGQKIGLAFQIQDDILDLTSSLETLGKPIKSDEKNNKTTYVGLIGLESSKDQVKKLLQEAINDLKRLNGDTEFLIQLSEFLIHRKK